MASQTVSTSAQLRTAIQQANSGDIITLNGYDVPFDVLTLAKNVCGSSEPTTLDSNYVIQGSGSTLLNTRIFQNNLDGPYGPGTVKGTASNLILSYESGGGATANTALFTAVNADYNLSALTITGNHTGWTGNGGKYFSAVAFVSDTINAKINLTSSYIDVTGQAGFDPNASNAGGSAFLHSWNNTQDVTLGNLSDSENVSGNIFDESGFLSSFNFYNHTYNNTLFTGKYIIDRNTFTRTSANRVFHANEGNRLTNVQANLTGNLFEKGSYLDLYGNISSVVFGVGTNTFSTVSGGVGIRANAVTGSIAQLVDNANVAFDVTNGGMPIENIDGGTALVPMDQSVFTLIAGTNNSNITLLSDTNSNPETFAQMSAGGRGNDLINAPATGKLWANGDKGNDTINGGNSDDLLYGGDGDDTIDAKGGNNRLFGGQGNDTMLSQDLADYLDAGTGNDYLKSGAGNDTLMGGDDNDTLIGDLANDTLTGGNGNDLFRFALGDGVDSITDFSTSAAGNIDQIGLANIFGGTNNATISGSSFTTNSSSITGIASGSSNKVICMQGSLTTNQISSTTSTGPNAGQVAPSGNAMPAYIVVFNSTVSRGQLWYDNNWSDRTGRQQLATFSTFTQISDVTSLTASNFFAYA